MSLILPFATPTCAQLHNSVIYILWLLLPLFYMYSVAHRQQQYVSSMWLYDRDLTICWSVHTMNANTCGPHSQSCWNVPNGITAITMAHRIQLPLDACNQNEWLILSMWFADLTELCTDASESKIWVGIPEVKVLLDLFWWVSLYLLCLYIVSQKIMRLVLESLYLWYTSCVFANLDHAKHLWELDMECCNIGMHGKEI